jgi:hypothetical protein
LKKFFAAAAVLALLGSATAAKANVIEIDFTWYGTATGVVDFTGTPEGNGNINRADLSAFSLNDSSGQSFGLSALNGFGTFNTITNTWSANAADWYGNLDAYVTANYNGGANSWSFAQVSFEQPITYRVVSDVAPVPEPASIALLASGLLGMGAFRRRKARSI